MKEARPEGGIMPLSIHYYVLSLSAQTCRLFEGFRETLITIHNGRFPFSNSHALNELIATRYSEEQLRVFFKKSDEHLAHYFDEDPLRIILVGEQEHLSLFESLTTHKDALIGNLVGAYTSVSSRHLGNMTWPIIKKVLAGTNNRAMHDLEEAAGSGSIVTGLDAVASALDSDVVYSLFLEEDYDVSSNQVSPSLLEDFNEAINDPVDIQVERVLEKGGKVVFLESGSMIKYQRIALITPRNGTTAG